MKIYLLKVENVLIIPKSYISRPIWHNIKVVRDIVLLLMDQHSTGSCSWGDERLHWRMSHDWYPVGSCRASRGHSLWAAESSRHPGSCCFLEDGRFHHCTSPGRHPVGFRHAIGCKDWPGCLSWATGSSVPSSTSDGDYCHLETGGSFWCHHWYDIERRMGNGLVDRYRFCCRKKRILTMKDDIMSP